MLAWKTLKELNNNGNNDNMYGNGDTVGIVQAIKDLTILANGICTNQNPF